MRRKPTSSNAAERSRHTGSDGTFKYTEEETGDQDVGVVLVSRWHDDRDQIERGFHGEVGVPRLTQP